MSHNERKSVPVPSVELKPTSQAVRTNKQKKWKKSNPPQAVFLFLLLLSLPPFFNYGPSATGLYLQPCLHQSALTHAAYESSPSMGGLKGKKTMPELLFSLTFHTQFLGAQWHVEVTDSSWELCLCATEHGRLEVLGQDAERNLSIFSAVKHLPTLNASSLGRLLEKDQCKTWLL